MRQPKAVTLTFAVEEFILDRESYGRRPKTILFYKVNLGQVTQFLDQHNITHTDQLGRRAVRLFLAELHHRKSSQATLAAYDRTLRTFCKFCVAESWIIDDPMTTRARIKPGKGLPDTLELPEISSLLDACTNLAGVRDKAIMLLMLDTGLRAGEVCALTLDRLKLNGDYGVVHIPAAGAKGESDRHIPIWTETITAIKAWMLLRPAANTLFVGSPNGRSFTTQPLTPNALNQIIRRRARRASLAPHRKWCHIWRHTMAKLFVKKGGDLETLRRILGHQSLETVRIYLAFRTADIEAKHSQLSPVRQLYEQADP